MVTPIPASCTIAATLTLAVIILLFLTAPLFPSLLRSITPPSSAAPRRTACAADYQSCGGAVLTPAGNLPCCNSSFYCYTQGPYFSQCRPTKELQDTTTRSWYRLSQHRRTFATQKWAARHAAIPLHPRHKLTPLSENVKHLVATLPKLTPAETADVLAFAIHLPAVTSAEIHPGALIVSTTTASRTALALASQRWVAAVNEHKHPFVPPNYI